MKIKTLVSDYKRIAKEMKEEVKKYKNLASIVEHSFCSDKTFAEYNNSWKRLIALNNEAYSVMYEYRKLCGSIRYKAMFFLGILPKQNTFRFKRGSKTEFKCQLLINLLNLR